MDPLSMIVAALAAGASAAVKDTAGQAVKEGYAALKALVKRKFGGKQTAEAVLENHEAEPEVWGRPLEKELADAGADQDEELVLKAKELLALADPGGTAAGKYNVAISGGKGIYVGDKGTVTMNFGDGGEDQE